MTNRTRAYCGLTAFLPGKALLPLTVFVERGQNSSDYGRLLFLIHCRNSHVILIQVFYLRIVNLCTKLTIGLFP